MTRLVDRFKLADDYEEEEEQEFIPAPNRYDMMYGMNNQPQPQVMEKQVYRPRKVTIWKKQKRGDKNKIKVISEWQYNKNGNLVKVPISNKQRYMEDNAIRLDCDMVSFKDGMLYCTLKDDIGEEVFDIKDIEEFII